MPRRIVCGAGLLAVLMTMTSCATDGGDAAESSPSTRSGSSAPAAITGTPVPSTPVPGTPAPSPTSDPATTPDTHSVLVTFTESGGIDGRHNSLVVYEDGRFLRVAPRSPDRPGRMTPADLAALRAALDDVDFSRLRSRPTGPPVMDGLTRVVVHDGHTAVDDGTDTPAALADVYAALPPLT
ncbi:hypothetical protein ABZ729_27525 [Streptomyces sp. NPDC006678]|uniref:hypothetical protein n=1 Tax=Streptomyces sp. NPDC006678 TaxID=3157185 RepID=UPI00340D1B40